MPTSSACATTQTELLPTRLEFPFIRFLTDNSPSESILQLPYCYHFGITGKGIRSPKIPILVDGIIIPVVVDTGAEVSMLSDEAMLKHFPEGYWAHNNQQVKSLGGSVVTIKGSIRLPVKVCSLQIMHEFYHLDGMEQSLLGFDLFQAAALVIDLSLIHISEPTRPY